LSEINSRADKLDEARAILERFLDNPAARGLRNQHT